MHTHMQRKKAESKHIRHSCLCGHQKDHETSSQWFRENKSNFSQCLLWEMRRFALLLHTSAFAHNLCQCLSLFCLFAWCVCKHKCALLISQRDSPWDLVTLMKSVTRSFACSLAKYTRLRWLMHLRLAGVGWFSLPPTFNPIQVTMQLTGEVNFARPPIGVQIKSEREKGGV